MKNIYSSILIFTALTPIFAQEVPVSASPTAPTQAPTQATPIQSASQEKSASPAGGVDFTKMMPSNFGGGNLDANAIFSSLGGSGNLSDILGNKVDDAQTKIIRARFEKYLNSPPATSVEDLEYNQLLIDINQRLAGKGGGTDDERTFDAWRMLFKAEAYPMDDQLCRTIGDKVINFWQTTKKIARLKEQNEALEKDKLLKESSMRSIQSKERQEFIDVMRGTKDVAPPPTREYETDPIKKRIDEADAKIVENKAYEGTSRMNQKLDFQSLIVQFFIQRRYYHAMIANDFYRYIFAAEDGKLEGVDALKGQMFGGLDIKLTTSSVDALCKEAINDTNKAVKAVEYLISKGELHSASLRLLEAFFVGENLAPIKTFPMDSKREILRYMRDIDKLANAIKVKHVERAETILHDIEGYVKDFDSGQIEAFIQTSKQLSNLALQKALVAAQTSSQAGIESSLQEAVEFWPTNPKIQEFLSTMLGKVDLKDAATSDFDRLIKQNDYRAIFNDRFRFAAALAQDNMRNKEFLEIMKRMETIETSMAQANELSKLKNNFAAWELLEKVYRQYPEDAELSRLRSDFTLKASTLASTISSAEEALSKGEKWVALLKFMDAKNIYPMSTLANEQITSLAEQILNEMH